MVQIEQISTRIQYWVYDHFPLAKEQQVGPTDSLLDSGIVDSLGTLDIVLFLEEEFGLARFFLELAFAGPQNYQCKQQGDHPCDSKSVSLILFLGEKTLKVFLQVKQ